MVLVRFQQGDQKQNQMVNFNEELHQYTNHQGEVYISATQVLEHYIPKFDKEFWMFYKVLQDKLGFPDDEFGKKAYAKYLIQSHGFNFKNKTLEELQSISDGLGFGVELEDAYKKAEWKKKNDDSLIRGTKFHEDIEKKRLAQKTKILECGNTVHYYSYNKGLENTEFGKDKIEGIPELRLYNHKYKIAGTTDDPVFYPTRLVDINDWKSNRVIKLKNAWEKMLYPLNHLDNSNFNHYNMQLSLYGWMLEQFGYEVRNLSITHILFDEAGNPIGKIPYPMKYLKREVEALLEHYANNH